MALKGLKDLTSFAKTGEEKFSGVRPTLSPEPAEVEPGISERPKNLSNLREIKTFERGGATRFDPVLEPANTAENKFWFIEPGESVLGVETGRIREAKEGDDPSRIIEHPTLETWDFEETPGFIDIVTETGKSLGRGAQRAFKDATHGDFDRAWFNAAEGLLQLPEAVLEISNNVSLAAQDEIFLTKKEELVREWSSSVRRRFKGNRRANVDQGGRGESIVGDLYETIGLDRETADAFYDQEAANVLGFLDPITIVAAGPKLVQLGKLAKTAVVTKSLNPRTLAKVNSINRLAESVKVSDAAKIATAAKEATAAKVTKTAEDIVSGKISPAVASSEELAAAQKLTDANAWKALPAAQIDEITKAAAESTKPSKFAKVLKERVLQPVSNVTGEPLKKLAASAMATARAVANPVRSVQELTGVSAVVGAKGAQAAADRTSKIVSNSNLLKLGIPVVAAFTAGEGNLSENWVNALAIGASTAFGLSNKAGAVNFTLSKISKVAEKVEKAGDVLRKSALVAKAGGGERAAALIAAKTASPEVQQALLKSAGIEISEDMAELAGTNILSRFGRTVTGVSSITDGLVRSAAIGGAIGYGVEPTGEGFLSGLAPGAFFGTVSWALETPFSKMLGMSPDQHSAYIRSVFADKTPEQQALLKSSFTGDPGGLALVLETENLVKGIGLKDAVTGMVSRDVDFEYVSAADFIDRYNSADGELVLDRAPNGVFIEKSKTTGKPTVLVRADAARKAGPHESQHVMNALMYNLDQDQINVNLQQSRDNVRQTIAGLLTEDEGGSPKHDGSGTFNDDQLADMLGSYMAHFNVEVLPGEPVVFQNQVVLDADGNITLEGRDIIIEEIHADAGMQFMEHAADMGVIRYAKWVADTSDRNLSLVMSTIKGSDRRQTRHLGESALFSDPESGTRLVNSPEIERAIAQQWLEKAGITDRLGVGGQETVPKQMLSNEAVREEGKTATVLQKQAFKTGDALQMKSSLEEVKRQVNSGQFKTRKIQPKDRNKVAKDLAKAVYATDTPSELQIASQLHLVPEEEFAGQLGGKLSPASQPIMLTPREIKKRDQTVFTELKAALNSLEGEAAEGGLTVTRKDDGTEYWHGAVMNEAQLEAIQKSSNIPAHVKTLVTQFNENAASGLPIQGWYYKVNRRRGNTIREKRNFSIISMNISKAQNLFVRAFDRTNWTRKAEKLFKAGRDDISQLYQKAGDRSWIDGYKRFESDTLQLLRNHEDGLPGATKLDPDARVAEKKRDAIIGFMGIKDMARGKDPNPYTRENNFIKSFRVDRMFDPKQGLGDPGRPLIGQERLKNRFLPETKGTTTLPSDLPEVFRPAKVDEALLQLRSSRTLDSDKAFLTSNGEFLEVAGHLDPLPYIDEFNLQERNFDAMIPVYEAGHAKIDRDRGTIFVEKTRPLTLKQEQALQKEANTQQKEVILDRGGLIGETKFMPSTVEKSFTSAAEEMISKASTRRMRVDQLRALLGPDKGVRKDEIKWRGLEEIFNRPDESIITLDEVQRVLDDNPLRMDKFTFASAAATNISDNFSLRQEAANLDRFDLAAETQYEVYNRETGNIEFKGAYDDAVTFAGGTPARQALDGGAIYHTKNLRLPGGENYREVVYSYPQEKDKYRPGHFQAVPNYLSHSRLTDRFTPEGDKVLFIEELQSDRHQDGRKNGYAPTRSSGRFEAAQQESIRIRDLTQAENLSGAQNFAMSQISFEFSQAGLAAPKVKERLIQQAGLSESLAESTTANMVEMREVGAFGDKVPDAPFKTTWMEYMMRDIIQQAVDGGYKHVAWTNGLMQSKRSGLGNFGVRDVAYSPPVEGSDTFTVFLGGEEQGAQNIRRKDLANNLGKDVANKIINGDGEVAPKFGRGSKSFEIEPVDIAAPGMSKFYDEMMVNKMNKYLKSEKGLNSSVRVEPTRFLAGEIKAVRDLAVTQEAIDLGAWRVVERSTEASLSDPFPTKAQAEARRAEILKEDEAKPKEADQEFVSHGFEITDDIQQKVTDEGQRFFMPDDSEAPPNWASHQIATDAATAEKVFKSINFRSGIDPTDSTMRNRFNGLAYYNSDTGLFYVRDIEDIPQDFRQRFERITQQTDEANPNDFQTNEELNRYPQEEQGELSFLPDTEIDKVQEIPDDIIGLSATVPVQQNVARLANVAGLGDGETEVVEESVVNSEKNKASLIKGLTEVIGL